MNFCPKCGFKLPEYSNFCSNCGTDLCSLNNNTNSNITYNNNSNSTTVAICAIISLMFPIIGIVLFFVFRRTDPHVAHVVNICTWISFLIALFICFICLFLASTI